MYKNYFKFLAIISVACIVIIFLAILYDGWIYLFTKYVIGLISVIIAVIGGLIYLISKKPKVFIYSIITLCNVIIFSISCYYIIEFQEKASYQRGNRIIKAIEQYYDINKLYPQSLEQLAPKYIKEIPDTSMYWFGRDFDYINLTRDKDIRYLLGFSSAGFGVYCTYDSSKKTWEKDESVLISVVRGRGHGNLHSNPLPSVATDY